MLLTIKYCDIFNFLLTEVSSCYDNETWPAAAINAAVISFTDEAASVIKIPTPSQKVQDSFIILNFCQFYILCLYNNYVSKEVKGNVKFNPLSSVLNNLLKYFFLLC